MLKKSDELKNAIVEQLRKTPIIQIACEKLNISRMSFYRWKNEDEAFAQKVDEALLDGQLLVNDLAESQLISAVKDRNMSAIMSWLKHHHPSYRTRVQIEGTINTIQEMSDEQKELVRKALALAKLNLEDYESRE
jgi:ACT domain-containing protein